MALDPDILLGRLAVGKKLLSQEQVRAALRAQAAETPRRPLGDVLVSEGLLSPEQVEGLLSLQAAYLAKERRTAGGPRRLEDVIFGKILVKHGLAPEEAVNRALAAQAESEESGSGGSRRLGEILVEEGTVAPDVVSKVLEFQEKKILACTGCGAQWNVANYDPDRDYRCRTCQGPLAIPALLKDVGVAGTLTLGRGTPQDDLTPATIGAEGLPSGVTIEEFEGAGRTRVDRGTLATRTGGGPRAGAEGGDEDATGALEGRSVGGCKILKKLGQGGMGAVYLAEHVGLDKKVAIKVIRSVAGTPASLVQRFLREAKSAAKLAHPNVVQVFNVGEDRGFHFIEMEFVEGRSVRDLIAEEKLDLEETIRILRECLKGLGEAHRQGLIHRDVKPDNILVARTGQVKIVDFGLARAVEGGEGDDITRSGQILGTPHFMSPEQCDGQKTDQRTDIYSLGATVYNMLTGEKPFVGETAMAILMKHINEDAAPIREKAPDVPEDLENIVFRMMAKRLEDRYAAAEDVLADLDKWDAGGAIAAPPRRRRRSGRKALVLVTLLALMAGGGAAAVATGLVPIAGLPGAGGAGRGGGPEETPLQRAERLVQAYEYEKAIPLLDAYLKKSPGDAKAVALLAEARFQDAWKTGKAAESRNDYAAAEESLRKALAQAPTEKQKVEVRQLLDSVVMARGRVEKRDAINQRTERAQQLAKARRWAEAQDEAEKAVQLDLENVSAKGTRAEIARLRALWGRLDAAVAQLDKADEALKAKGGDTTALGALDAAQKGLADLSPGDEKDLVSEKEAATQRAAALVSKAKLQGAERMAQDAKTAGHWMDAVGLFEQAAALAGSEEARSSFQAEARDCRAREAEKFVAEGESAYAAEQVQQAVQLFKKALELKPDPDLAARTKIMEDRAATPPGMVYAKAATVAFGSADPRDGNDPQDPRPFHAYYIGASEVTNEEYQRFVSEGGYAEEKWWDPEALPERARFVDKSGKPGPAVWSEGKLPSGAEKYPVTGVSWWEARAYARFAGMRLPTEWEWERAAAHDGERPKARAYPWGESFDARAAALDPDPAARSRPVRTHPQDRSPAGCFDMAGNVREWTDSEKDGKLRSVRGGGVGTRIPVETEGRVVKRRGSAPSVRDGSLGFRLAKGAPSEVPSGK